MLNGLNKVRPTRPSPGMSHLANPHTRECAFELLKHKLDERRMHGELSYLFNVFASQPGFKWGTSDVWMAKGEAFSESVVLQAFLPRAAGTVLT